MEELKVGDKAMITPEVARIWKEGLAENPTGKLFGPPPHVNAGAKDMVGRYGTVKSISGDFVEFHDLKYTWRKEWLRKYDPAANEAKPGDPTYKAPLPEVLENYIRSREELSHYLFPVVLAALRAKQNLFIVGPAGGGKTKAVELAAEQLEMPFYCQSVGAQTTMTHLIGYKDATGNYHHTAFREAFEKGGVFLLDEMDAGNPNVLTALNAALSNGYCSFPDKMVPVSKNFLCVACGNTYGVGPSRQYVGRNPIDAATLDRFAVLEWPYDEDLEDEIAENEDWVNRVQAVRAAIVELQIQAIVSPRASLIGTELLKNNLEWNLVEEMTIWKNMSPEIRKKLEPKAKEIEEQRKKSGQNKRKGKGKPKEKGGGQGGEPEENEGNGEKKSKNLRAFTMATSAMRPGDRPSKAEVRNEGHKSQQKATVIQDDTIEELRRF